MNMDNKSREVTQIMGIILSSIITAIFGIMNTKKAYKAQAELDARLDTIEANIADISAERKHESDDD